MEQESLIKRVVGYDICHTAFNKKGQPYIRPMVAWGRVLELIHFNDEPLTVSVKNIHTEEIVKISVLKINTVMPATY